MLAYHATFEENVVGLAAPIDQSTQGDTVMEMEATTDEGSVADTDTKWRYEERLFGSINDECSLSSVHHGSVPFLDFKGLHTLKILRLQLELARYRRHMMSDKKISRYMQPISNIRRRYV